MKSIRKVLFTAGNYPKNIDFALLFLRLTIGIFMLTHGVGKFQKLFEDGPVQFADPIGIGENASLALVVLAEFFCSLLLIFGIITRPAALVLIINMSVAAFIAHAGDAFMVREMALLYLAVYIVMAIAGAGKFSIDHWIDKRSK